MRSFSENVWKAKFKMKNEKLKIKMNKSRPFEITDH